MSTSGGIKDARGIPLIHRKLCPLPFPRVKKKNPVISENFQVFAPSLTFCPRCQIQHIICTCPPNKKVPVEERKCLRDRRAKKGPKGSFHLGPVDKAAVKRDKRTPAEAERLQKQTEKQQEVAVATFAPTSQNICFESGSEELGEPSGSEAEEFKPVREPSGSYNLLKTPIYAMELIRGNVSSNLGASLANALLLDLQAVDLLRPGVDVKDKSKIDKEKSRMKVKSDKKHKEDPEKLIACIGDDGKIDMDTLMYREVMDENGETKLRKEREKSTIWLLPRNQEQKVEDI